MNLITEEEQAKLCQGMWEQCNKESLIRFKYFHDNFACTKYKENYDVNVSRLRNRPEKNLNAQILLLTEMELVIKWDTE